MDITRITLPKFKVGRYTLNEYELRQLQLEVAQGLKPGGIKVKSLSNGDVVTITETGYMNRNFNDGSGYDVSSKITLNLIKIKRENAKKCN